MFQKLILKTCSTGTRSIALSILILATFQLNVLADMLPPNWDKMSGKEKEAYYKGKAEQRQRLKEAYDLRQKNQKSTNSVQSINAKAK